MDLTRIMIQKNLEGVLNHWQMNYPAYRRPYVNVREQVELKDRFLWALLGSSADRKLSPGSSVQSRLSLTRGDHWSDQQMRACTYTHGFFKKTEKVSKVNNGNKVCDRSPDWGQTQDGTSANTLWTTLATLATLAQTHGTNRVFSSS